MANYLISFIFVLSIYIIWKIRVIVAFTKINIELLKLNSDSVIN